MRRGTTAEQIFAVPYDLSKATVFVTWKQNDNLVMERTNDGLQIEDGVIIAKLSQEDTLAFEKGVAHVQIRYVDADGFADASKEMSFKVKDVLKDGVITYAG